MSDRSAPPVLRLTKPLGDAIAQGHPWIFDRALPPQAARLPSGSLVRIDDDRGFVALAFADPESPIRARVLCREPGARPDAGWAKRLARDAADRRSRDPLLVGCDGIRAVHGEADRLPGLVVDVYAGTAVVLFDGRAAAAFWAPLVPAVLDGLRDGGLTVERAWIKGDRRGATPYAIGDPPPALIEIGEDQARFAVDVVGGQKTGFFLDQRDNRRTVAAHAAGATVLNLFSYNGGFSLKASLGGAARVTSVDSAPRAIESLLDNVRRSGLPVEAHEAVCADAFEFLAQAAARGRRWDLVIADPPSFAPSERAKPAALRGYAKLVEACLRVVEPRGRFALASCSSHITEPDLLAVLATTTAGSRAPAALDRGAAASGGPRRQAGPAPAASALTVRVSAGAASDHPVLPGFPEGRYLKFLLCDL